jgi:hypothetical protein
MASLSGVFNVQQFTDAGLPLASGRLYTYAPNTTTHKTAYTDAAGAVPQTYTSDGAGGQYIALNARGELPAALFLTDGGYDLLLKRSDGSTVWTRRAIGTDDAAGTLRTDLASTNDAAKGAGMVGYSRANAYPANTIGRHSNAFKSVLDDGTISNAGLIGCGAALNLKFGSGGEWWIPAGTYLIDQDLIVPDSCKIVFEAGAQFIAGANNLTFFKSTTHAYLSQVWYANLDANGKTGVTGFDMTGFRNSAGIYYPFLNELATGIILRSLCWDTMIVQPTGQGVTDAIKVLDGSNAVLIDKPGFDGLGSAGVGILIQTGPGNGGTYDTTSVLVQGGYIQGYSVGIQDDQALGTTIDNTYFEQNTFADVYFNGSISACARNTQHYANIGENAYFARNCDAVTVWQPLMTSGARTRLFNFDTSNLNCHAYRVRTNGGMNDETGSTVSGLGYIPDEDSGTFTPGVKGSTAAGTGATIDAASSGKWRRIGRRVNIKVYVKWSTLAGATGNLNITGAPVALNPTSYSPTGIGTVIALMAWTGQYLVCSLTGAGTTIQILQLSTAGSFSPLAVAAAGEVYLDLTYDL